MSIIQQHKCKKQGQDTVDDVMYIISQWPVSLDHVVRQDDVESRWDCVKGRGNLVELCGSLLRPGGKEVEGGICVKGKKSEADTWVGTHNNLQENSPGIQSSNAPMEPSNQHLHTTLLPDNAENNRGGKVEVRAGELKLEQRLDQPIIIGTFVKDNGTCTSCTIYRYLCIGESNVD